MTNQEAFVAAIKSRLNGDKNHGWGTDDSVAVILAVAANENGATPLDYETGDGLENFTILIKAVVNPSAFRQVLESKGQLNKSAGGKKANAVNDLLKSL